MYHFKTSFHQPRNLYYYPSMLQVWPQCCTGCWWTWCFGVDWEVEKTPWLTPPWSNWPSGYFWAAHWVSAPERTLKGLASDWTHSNGTEPAKQSEAILTNANRQQNQTISYKGHSWCQTLLEKNKNFERYGKWGEGITQQILSTATDFFIPCSVHHSM